MSYYYNPKIKKPKRYVSKIIGVLLVLWLFGEVGLEGEELLALLTLGSLGYIGYKFTNLGLSYWGKQAKVDKQTIDLRISDLKRSIRRVDKQVNLLETYLTDQAFTQYGVLARQVLSQVKEIKEEAYQLQKHIEPTVYQRITLKADSVSQDITKQLTLLQLQTEEPIVDQEADRVARIAPELLTTYRSIKTDHETMLEKIKTSDNQAELEALHETNMKRFRDILDGYLKIKETPKNFHNAEERLALARQALEQFDLELDQSLRELNESDLADFEVSLRMMSKTSHDPLQDNTLD